MARSLIQVTQGTGTKLATNNYTDGADSKHDEVVVLGEQFLASYMVAPLVAISTATLDSHLLQVMAGASNKVRVRRIEVYQSAMATTGALMDIALYRLTTGGTGGSSVGPTVLDPSDPAAGATAMVLPTSKGTEGQLMYFSRAYMTQTLGASSPIRQPILVIDFESPRSKPLIIAAGTSNGIALKNRDAVAGGSVYINVWLDESPY